MGKPGLNRLYAAYKPHQGRMQAAEAWRKHGLSRLKQGLSLPKGRMPAPGVGTNSGTQL